jgi:hypothetical protein
LTLGDVSFFASVEFFLRRRLFDAFVFGRHWQIGGKREDWRRRKRRELSLKVVCV